MKLSRLALFALPVAVSMIACGSSSSSGGGSTPLAGTYVPVGDITKAEFAHITFSSATAYDYTRANCSSACNSTGTYTFDGNSNLDLTDGTSGQTEHVAFQALKRSGDSTTLLKSVHPLGLVMNAGSPLVNDGGMLISGDAGSLVDAILQALMNGIQMALQQAMMSGDDGGSSSSGDDDTNSDAGAANACQMTVASCLAQGGTFSMSADGSCTCANADSGAVDAGTDAADGN